MIAALPELQTFQRAARAGLLEVGVVPDNGRTFQHLIGTKVGGSSFDSSGRRHTAADILRYADPNRITVLLWANTQRVLFTESKSSRCLSSRMKKLLAVSLYSILLESMHASFLHI
jgi:choline dehydrogenase